MDSFRNDTYGSTELGRLAFECNEHSGLHVLTDASVLEFIDDSGEYTFWRETAIDITDLG